MITPVYKIIDWIISRFELSPLLDLAGKKTVPVHKQSFWYYMGGLVMILLVEQVVTGLLLMIYYIPELKSAHSSILLINSQVDFGWFIRSLHSWGANLMIFFLFVHLFSTYFMKAYRAPREMTWISGILLLGLVFGFGFTGYLLPWDDVSFFATKIGIDIAGKTPLLGDTIATILRGGTAIGQNTLSRFFVIHVMLLPLLLLPLLGLHLWIIQAKGMSTPEPCENPLEEDEEPKVNPLVKGTAEKSEKFFPDFLLKDFVAWILILNALAILVALFPWGLGQEADPFAPAPAGIKPEWYFLAMFQFLKLIPSMIGPIEGEQLGMLFFGLIGLGLLGMLFSTRGYLDKELK
jgi:quinol-cytochrome oxidoreductase complex cytochrome b subunit